MKRFLLGMIVGAGLLFGYQNRPASSDQTASDRVPVSADVAASACIAAGNVIDQQAGSTDWRDDAAEIVGELGILFRDVAGDGPSDLVDAVFNELAAAAEQSPGSADDTASQIANRGRDYVESLIRVVRERCD